MLECTFRHLTGIGPRAEAKLWAAGCRSWEALEEGHANGALPKKVTAKRLREELDQSRQALAQGVHQYFAERLPEAEHWRCLPHFPDTVCYLDIETTGGRPPDDRITVIGLHDHERYLPFVQGDNLEAFRDAITHYSVVVTFSGGNFDLPMIRREMGIALDHLHIDLCPALRRVGVGGGLKKIEQAFGLERSPETQGLTGWDAVKLWRRHINGDRKALRLLIEYNRHDVLSLLELGRIAYQRLREATLENQELPVVKPRRKRWDETSQLAYQLRERRKRP